MGGKNKQEKPTKKPEKFKNILNRTMIDRWPKKW